MRLASHTQMQDLQDAYIVTQRCEIFKMHTSAVRRDRYDVHRCNSLSRLGQGSLLVFQGSGMGEPPTWNRSSIATTRDDATFDTVAQNRKEKSVELLAVTGPSLLNRRLAYSIHDIFLQIDGFGCIQLQHVRVLECLCKPKRLHTILVGIQPQTHTYTQV